MLEELKIKSRELFDTMVNDRRIIHKYPEVGFELTKTTKYVKSRLIEMGYEPEEISKSGIVATVGEGKKTILLRADMDALFAPEENDLPYKSNNDAAHLCGHDIHTSMLLGVAQILKEYEDKLDGRVKLMFQPAEEIGLGAKSMVDSGLLEDVDAAMAIHVSNDIEAGKISYVKGICSASLDAIMIEVQGKGGHSSTPYLSIDPLMIVNNIYLMLNTMIGREVDPENVAVLTIGKMGGGTAANIIPDTAILEGTLRCFDPKVRDYTLKRCFEIIEQVTKALRGSYKVTCDIATPSVINNEDLCDEMHKYMAEVLGEESVIVASEPLKGTEDFSYVSEKVPSILAWIGAGGINDYPLHNPNVIFNEDVMPFGCSVLANCAISWLKNNK